MSDKLIYIDNLSHDARGVGRNADGKTVFVQGALPSEQVRYHVIKTHKRYDEAQATEILSPSADRVTPQCEFFSTCGGCALQHLSADRQIIYKQSWLKTQLWKVAKVKPKVFETPLSGRYWHYRYKARLGVAYIAQQQRVVIGFRSRKSHHIEEVSSCEILHVQVNAHLSSMREMVQHLNVRDKLSYIEVAATEKDVALNFKLSTKPNQQDYDLLLAFGQKHGFAIYLQHGSARSTELCYAPAGFSVLRYKATADCELAFQPYQFTQVNPLMNQKMIAQAIDWLELLPQDRVLDLFCGIGNFSLPIARHVSKVVGVEGDKTSIERAKQNAQHNAVENSDFYVADLFKPQHQANWANPDQPYDKVLLDPPRAGAAEVVSLLAEKLCPMWILYISCDPATLARDTERLCAKGYALIRAGVIDMFPQTAHVESMLLFQRVGKTK